MGSINSLYSQDIRIGLFEDRLVNTIVFHSVTGGHDVISDDKVILSLKKAELIYISYIGSMLSIHDGTRNYGLFDFIRIDDVTEKGLFNLKIVDPTSDARDYQGDIEVFTNNSVLQIINELPLENYLAGVVETEGGPGAPTEYYKAQAILCRTYALKHWNRHESQNFNLCDDTHCQSYKGINDENSLIFEAVLSTHKLVINNMKYTLINPSFHSNSGGETQRADDIWGNGEEYLQAVLDPYSEKQKNSRWSKTISLVEWRNYIFTKTVGDTSKLRNENFLVEQNHRKKFLIAGTDTLLLADIRKDWDFRSSFFSMELKNDSILISGKGYGHGVGMSQEGAIEMAKQGFSYADIIKFYYDMINISDIDDLPDNSLPVPFR